MNLISEYLVEFNELRREEPREFWVTIGSWAVLFAVAAVLIWALMPKGL